MAGAVGEVAQICMFYPLETIKVRCQADCIGALQVVRALVTQHGVSLPLLLTLYSGFSSAAIFSMLVGSVHWLSFCMAKRTALELLPCPNPAAPAGLSAHQALPPPASSASSARSQPALPSPGSLQQDVPALQPEGPQQPAQARRTGGLPALSPPHTQPLEQASSEDAAEEMGTKTAANMMAAIAGATATALVEAPVELFRHRAQAGLISGNLIAEMGKAVRVGGPFALWQGFLPFCLEAFPYDMSELGCYSQLRDVYEHVSKPGGRLQSVARMLPAHVWDLAIGGAAGAAGVLVSMPFDCVKTYMQTHSTEAIGSAPGTQVAVFFRTGAAMVRRRGLKALFVGLAPRLVQQVPSSIICWWAVERMQLALAPYAQGGASEPGPH